MATEIKLWHQSMAEIEDLQPYGSALATHAREVCSTGTEVALNGLPRGAYRGQQPSDVLGYADVYFDVSQHVLVHARQAEREGYDAFVVGSFSDPLLRQLRAAVDIPVVSVAESCVLVAQSLGRYVSLISNAPSIARIVRTHLQESQMDARIESVRSIQPPRNEAELVAAYDNPDEVIASFIRAAEEAVRRGADVVIPAEIVMSELLYREGVSRVGKTPVLDSMAVCWHYAEMLVRLWRSTGTRVGRQWEFARQDAPKDES